MRLQHKIQGAQGVLTNLDTPGWIEGKNPKARGLAIEEHYKQEEFGDEYRKKLERVVRIKARLRDRVIPLYQGQQEMIIAELAQEELQSLK